MPDILTQSVSQICPVGSNLTLFVTATNNRPLIYQWLKNGIILPGATADSLALTNVSKANNGNYQVTVSNTDGMIAWSSNALVTVSHPPLIQSQSADRTIRKGETASFQVMTALSTPLGKDYPPETYQWYKDGITISGANQDRITFCNAQETDTGVYTLQITSVDGVLMSAPIKLTVLGAPQINWQPQSQVASAGVVINLSITAVGSDTLYYQWYKDGKMINGATNSLLSFPAEAGSYQCTVSNAAGQIQSQIAVITIKDAEIVKGTIAVRNGKSVIIFKTVGNKTYHIKASSNLRDWTVIATDKATDVPLQFEENQTAPLRFFRCDEVAQ